ncbi:MAG: 16S rRNA (guanine(527)-N(7))-methyltransferase RsmG [Chloroflexota bacterium]|nr:16S rRNA (guanine(527)-N(7))-methyltransferase RsmG [Chloroflexota bacterium]
MSTAHEDARSDSHRDLAALEEEAARLGLGLDEVTRDRFARYLTLMEVWRDRAGLTALTDPAAVQRRLFGESLALLVALRSRGVLTAGEPSTVVDVGAGAGFPGVPMRIVDPLLRLTLVESHGRRARFLETVVEELELEGVEVVTARAEEAGRDPAYRERFDVAVARALAPLPVLVEYLLPLVRPGGVMAAPKGSGAERELGEAAAAIEALGGCAEEPVPLSLPEGAALQRVIVVRRCGELPERFPRRPGIPAKRPLR